MSKPLGMFVNHKKIKRLMREHGLQPRIRRRYVATTDSDHDQPIFPNRTKDVIVLKHQFEREALLHLADYDEFR